MGCWLILCGLSLYRLRFGSERDKIDYRDDRNASHEHPCSPQENIGPLFPVKRRPGSYWLGTAAFLLADAYHISPAWVFVVWLSVGFFAAVGWDYRKEFKSGSFVLFFAAWLLLHSVIFALVATYWGWLCYLGAAFVELFFFYATAFWLFGLRPPPRRN
jgi:hypothetical protein